MSSYWVIGCLGASPILEFDNLRQVHAWLESPEYTALDDIRSGSSNINMVVVEGL